VDSDEHARSTCGVLDLRQQLVRRSVWQWRWSAAAGVDGLLVAIGRRRGFGAGPAMMVVTRSGATNTTLAATRRHRCRHGMAAADCTWFRSRPETVVAPAALNDHQNLAEFTISLTPHARARRWDADDGTGGAMRARGRRATAPPFQQLR
jgi:hypothetical protein